MEEWLFDAVQATLSDPRRRKQVGTDRKHLGSGLYLCGLCDHPVRAHASTQNGRQQLRYRCPVDGHVTRSAAQIDDLVLRAVRARLAEPDLRNLLAKPASKEARQAAEEIRRLRGRLEQTRLLDYDNDLIDGARYKAKTAKLQAQLDAAEVAQARLMAGSEVAGTLTATNPVAAFDRAPLGAQRAVISFLMTVRLDPAPAAAISAPGRYGSTGGSIAAPVDRTAFARRSHLVRALLATYLSAHRTMINGSALCAAPAVTERD